MNEILTKDESMNMLYNQTNDSYYLENAGLDVEAYEALKLSKDIKTKILSVHSISRAEIRTLVNIFYQMQKIRIALREQIRSIEQGKSNGGENKEVNIAVLDFILTNATVLENNIKTSLELFVQSTEEGRWLLAIKGIGPVLAAGLLGHLDVTDKDYATQFINFAGLNDNNRPWLGVSKSEAIVKEVMGDAKKLDDDMVREIAQKTQWSYNYLLSKAYKVSEKTGKGSWNKQKLINACATIPYNKSLKVLMYKVGSSFQWNCNKPDSKYGSLFNQRRDYEMNKNEAGEYAEQAHDIITSKNWSDKTSDVYKTYESGKLPKGHINMRAMRWTEKIFLSHLFEEMYRVRNDKIPPRYYSLEHFEGQHNKEIAPEVPYTKVTGEK